MDVDLRNTRGRLIRLAISASIALAVTIVAMLGIDATNTRGPNSDPIGSSSVGLLAIFMFVLGTAGVDTMLRRLAKR
jgi:hypothetical protein